METTHIEAIDNFNRAVTALVLDKDGIEATPTEAVEAVLVSLPAAAQAVADNPDWHQADAAKRAINATGALMTTLTVVSDQNPAIVADFAFAWGQWLQSRLNAAKSFINESQERQADDSD